MTVIEGTRGHLLALSTIATVVDTRVYPLRLPQPKKGAVNLPAIVLTRISNPRLGKHLRGPGELSRARIQVDCWAQTHDAATALGTMCRQRLAGFAGTWTGSGSSPAPTISVKSIEHDDDGDHFEEDLHGGICRHSADYFVTSTASEDEMTAFD